MTDPYSDERTGVLLNKPGIRDKAKLAAFERMVTTITIVELRKRKYQEYSFETVKEIHKNIFEKVYAWAGIPRTVEISKGGTGFCRSMFIESAAQDMFVKLGKKGFLKGLDCEAFCAEAARFFCDLNMLHPFREGNGRMQRELIFHLARNAGYVLDLSMADKDRYLRASVSGIEDASEIRAVMRELIEPL